RYRSDPPPSDTCSETLIQSSLKTSHENSRSRWPAYFQLPRARGPVVNSHCPRLAITSEHVFPRCIGSLNPHSKCAPWTSHSQAISFGFDSRLIASINVPRRHRSPLHSFVTHTLG